MIINIQRNELKKTKVYDTYWKFACERQNIFMRKLKGDKFPLTDDLILREYKFTNSYRASDRVSQYLIKNVIYQNEYTEEDAVFRILLFKTFNKIETWKKLESKLGRISYRNFSVDQYGKILKDCYNTGDTLYSGAYIMASGKSVFGQERKFMNHLMLIDYMMKDHFRKGGYTEQLLQEAQILKDRLKTKNIYLKNYVAWPIYLADTLETKKWIAKYCDLLEIKEIPIDETVSDLIETNKRFLTPDTVDNCYVWSKSLTKMRYEMIKDCNARICAGGKKIGYKGKMPGILEEIIIASELGCPLYLLGGFGGIVHDVCELLQNNKCTDSLTEEWQVSFNKGYKELLQKYKERDEEIKYLELQEKMKCINLNNGLTMKENEILFNTVYVDEAVQLVLKGLQSI